MSGPQTIIDKLWSAHEIARREDGAALLWVDRRYVHEGSFLAFDQIRKRRRTVAEPTLTFGIADHYVPTRGRERSIADPSIADMVGKLETNTSGDRIIPLDLETGGRARGVLGAIARGIARPCSLLRPGGCALRPRSGAPAPCA